jgi:hypothetical protein
MTTLRQATNPLIILAVKKANLNKEEGPRVINPGQ